MTTLSPAEETIVNEAKRLAAEEEQEEAVKKGAPPKLDPKDMFLRGTIELMCSDKAEYFKRGERFYIDMALFRGKGLLGLESMELTSFVLRLAKTSGNIMLRTADVELIKDHVRLHAMETAKPLSTDNRAAMKGDEILLNTGWRGSDLIVIKPDGTWCCRTVTEHIFEPIPEFMQMAVPQVEPAAKFPELLKAGIGDFGDRHCLIAASMGTMLLPAFFPHPFLTFTGEQARGKSTTMKLLLQLIDPYAGGELMSVGEDTRDLISMCRDRHCIALDNVSSLPFDEDLLSKMYSGGIFMARKMTTNSELSTAHIPMMRVMLNGIGPAFTRSDLMSRCIFIEHPLLTTGASGGEDFLSLTVVQRRWQAKLPEMLGSLLSAVSQGWKLFQDRGGLDGKTSKCRYVEYAVIGECIAEVMGYKAGEFTAQVNGTAEAAKTNAIEADDCAQLVIEWLNGARGTGSQNSLADWDDMPGSATKAEHLPGKTQYIISSSDLFSHIQDLAASKKYSVYSLKWLASVKAFSTAINRSARNIRNGGWDLRQIAGGERRRNWDFVKQGTIPLIS